MNAPESVSLALGLDCMTIYRKITTQSPVAEVLHLLRVLDDPDCALREKAQLYSRAAAACFQYLSAESWLDWLIHAILKDENAFTRLAAAREGGKLADPSKAALLQAVACDLIYLQNLANLDCRAIRETLRGQAIERREGAVLKILAALPDWFSSADPAPVLPAPKTPSPAPAGAKTADELLRLSSLFRELAPEKGGWSRLVPTLYHFHHRHGHSLLPFYHAFSWSTVGGDAKAVSRSIQLGGARLEGIESDFSSQNPILYDYTKNFARLKENTARLLKREGGENALLYGPRGTGKSSAVRALQGEFSGSGLRLIELKREEIARLPELFIPLQNLALSFIIYLDDLTFDTADREYALFKNILEGSLCQRPDNVLIYVTSNRRHLVGERFSETENALYANEVRDERLSLAERFGLKLRFTYPSQADFINLLHCLLTAYPLRLDTEETAALERDALAFAARESRLSPRIAALFLQNYLSPP